MELAVEIGKTVIVLEHRKECSDWPQWDVDPCLVLDERNIDITLLTISEYWEKHAMANNMGSVKGPRNLV